MFARSKSLDSEGIDTKKQVALVEQEASVLRQKLEESEAENEKLSAENTRLKVHMTRKVPSLQADNQVLENIELKDKIQELQTTCIELEEKCISLSAELEESDLKVAKSKKTVEPSERHVRQLEEEARVLRRKLGEIEAENATLKTALSKRRGSSGSTKSLERNEQMEEIPETKEGLIQRVVDLDDEISKYSR